ncbi:MAG: DUF2461 domain-containing protein [Bacteroidota bacterium]
MDAYPPFPGFREEAFQFLLDLRQNNERDWFKPRKATYEDELLWPARCLVGELAEALPRAGVPLTGNPKKAPFRIYRDTRFSKNKDPYKTHLGLVLSRDGDKKNPGALYIHVEPGGSFLAAGFWQPDSPLLRLFRERLVNRPDEWLAIADDLGQAGIEINDGPSGKLKRMPRGFESYADSPVADTLKLKGLVAQRNVDVARTKTPAFSEDVVEFAKDVLPLLAWGWSLMDESPTSG